MADARREMHAKSYQRHKDRWRQQNKGRRAERYRYAAARKNVPCADCGGRWPSIVMEFDHVRGAKDKSVSQLCSNNVTLERIQAEIDKCDVVCSNCHRLRSAARGTFATYEAEPEEVIRYE